MAIWTISLLLCAAFALGHTGTFEDTTIFEEAPLPETFEETTFEGVVPFIETFKETTFEQDAPLVDAAETIEEEDETQTFATKQCWRGWDKHDSHCYTFFHSLTRWEFAELYCRRVGGNMASVHSFLEYRFLQIIVKKNTNMLHCTWIGASDKIQEGTWRWTDGSAFNYHNWSKGNPNNLTRNEDCMEMNYGDT